MDGREARRRHPEFVRLLLHQPHEPLRRTRHVQGEGDGGVVRRLDHQGVEELLHGEGLVLGEVDLRAPDAGRLRRRRDRLLKVERLLSDPLQDDQQVHQLHDARRVALGVGVLLEDRPARLRVHHDRPDIRRPGARGDLRARGGRGGRAERGEQQDGGQQGGATKSFHRFLLVSGIGEGKSTRTAPPFNAFQSREAAPVPRTGGAPAAPRPARPATATSRTRRARRRGRSDSPTDSRLPTPPGRTPRARRAR